MRYDLYPALKDDIEAGSIWLSSPKFTSRTVVKVRNTESGRGVFCEVKMIDNFYLDNYRELIGKALTEPGKAVFVNAWYRKRLGIELSDKEVSLDVTAADSIYGQIRACLNHPQVVVRIAMGLGLWSFVLSLIGLAFAIIPLLPEGKANQSREPTATAVAPAAGQPSRQP